MVPMKRECPSSRKSGVVMEKFFIGLMFFIFAFTTGYLYGHDFGYEDGKAYQRAVDNQRLQNAHTVITRNMYAK